MGSQPPPLEGLRVVDFSRVLAGPHCGRMLVDLGADVVKIEPPEGDLTRFSAPRVHSMSVYFAQQNCGKRNVSLDFSDSRGIAVATRLAAMADVVLEKIFPPSIPSWFSLRSPDTGRPPAGRGVAPTR